MRAIGANDEVGLYVTTVCESDSSSFNVDNSDDQIITCYSQKTTITLQKKSRAGRWKRYSVLKFGGVEVEELMKM